MPNDGGSATFGTHAADARRTVASSLVGTARVNPMPRIRPRAAAEWPSAMEDALAAFGGRT